MLTKIKVWWLKLELTPTNGTYLVGFWIYVQVNPIYLFDSIYEYTCHFLYAKTTVTTVD